VKTRVLLAAEALAFAPEPGFDLVVVANQNMSGTTGISLCEELGANRPDPAVLRC
jgi:hypothetical protein